MTFPLSIHTAARGDIAEGQVLRVAWDDEGARFFVGGELRGRKVAWGGAPPTPVRAVASMGSAGQSATLAGWAGAPRSCGGAELRRRRRGRRGRWVVAVALVI